MGPGSGVAGGRLGGGAAPPPAPKPFSSSGFPYLSLLPFLPRLHHPLHGLLFASGALAYLLGEQGSRALSCLRGT